MWWRQAQKQFNQDSRAGNKRKFKQLVARGTVPGIIPYSGSDPVGWCAVQPREEFVRLEESRILAPVDERPIWSVTCLFVAKESRGDGVSTALLKAAAKHVKKSGGRIVEGYPV
jgi:GNAT superfamily N-acetyltransferase